MANNAQNEFAFYRSKTTEELLALLQSESSAVVYRALVVLQSHKLDNSAYDLLKNINDNGRTFKNRKMASALIHRFFPKDAVGVVPGESKVIGYVYFIQNQETGAVKIGRAKDLERRIAIFSDDFPFPIRLIQHIYTLNYEKIELAFHHHFDKKRIHGEWFTLDEVDIEQIKQKKFPEEIAAFISPGSGII